MENLQNVSLDFKNLLKSLLSVDPKNRPEIEDLKKSPFYTTIQRIYQDDRIDLITSIWQDQNPQGWYLYF